MKRKLFGFTMAAMLCITSVFGISVVAEAPGVRIYVCSETGNDANPGTENKPLKTIDKAKELVLEKNQNMQSNITVYIKGRHYLEQPLTFTESDSGNNGYRVIYTSWGETKPTLSMGKTFTGFTLHDIEKNIYKINVGKDTITRQAYFNHKKGIRARSTVGLKNPEFLRDTVKDEGDTDANYHLTGAYYLSEDTGLLDFAYPNEVEMKFHAHWTDPLVQIGTVEAQDNRVKITPNQNRWKKMSGSIRSYAQPSDFPSYLENAYEFLDAKGEWYLNPHEGYLYYIPRDGENMASMELTIPIGEDLITMEGTLNKPVHHITFQNLEFCDVGWTFPTTQHGLECAQNYTNDFNDDGTPEDAPAAVTVKNAQYIDFIGNDFTRIGKNGLNLLTTVKHCVVTANEFYDLSGRAITAGSVGGRNPLTANTLYHDEEISVTNNYVHDVCTDYMGMGAITVGYVKNSRFNHNEITNVPYSGFHVGWGWKQNAEKGSDMYNIQISNNLISETCNDRLYDGGGIYTVGSQSLDAVETKSRIQGNYLVNNRNAYAAIYPDEGSTGWDIQENVIEQRDVPVLEFNWDMDEILYENWYWLMMNFDAETPDTTTRHNIVQNNYSTKKTIRYNDESAKDSNVLEEAQEFPEANWNDEAKSIIDAAGIEPQYAANFALDGAKHFVMRDRTYNLKAGETTPLDMKVTGRSLTEFTPTDFNIQYYVEDETVATIAADGTIHAKHGGSTEAMVTAEVGGRTQVKQIRIQVEPALVANGGTDTIQFEDFRNSFYDTNGTNLLVNGTLNNNCYQNKVDVYTEANNQTDGGYIHFDTTNYKTTQEADAFAPITLDVPITVAKAGVYTFSLISGGGSAPKLSLDGGATSFYDVVHNSAEKLDGYFGSNGAGYKSTATQFLTEGIQNLRITLPYRTITVQDKDENGTVTGNHKEYDVYACLDALTLSYVEDNDTVLIADGTGVSRIEFESLSGQFKNSRGQAVPVNTTTTMNWGDAVNVYDTLYDGTNNGFVRFDTTNYTTEADAKAFAPVTLDIPLYVTIGGNYAFELVTGGGSSPKLSLDGGNTNIFEVVNTDAQNVGDTYFLSKSGVGYKSSFTYPLTEGMQTLRVTLPIRKQKTGGNAITGYKYQYDVEALLDYLQITYVAQDNIAVSEDENGNTAITAVGCYEETPPSGTAILALYNGDELVKIETMPVTGQDYFAVSATAQGKVTKAKLMVWSDLLTVIPQVPVKLFYIES